MYPTYSIYLFIVIVFGSLFDILASDFTTNYGVDGGAEKD